MMSMINALLFAPVRFTIHNVGLISWTKHPHAGTQLGNQPSKPHKPTAHKKICFIVLGKMERKLKKTHPQDLPSLALSRSNPTHPNSQLDTLPKYTPNTRTLKRYTAVSVNNLINRYSVTAYSLSEARSLLPAFTVVTSWTLVKELAE